MKREKSKLAGTTRPLPEDLNKRLTAYALAATAAGMSLMGAAAPVMANIITDTPTPPFEVGPIPTGFQVFFGSSVGLLGFSDKHFKNGSGSLLAGTVAPLGIPGVMLSSGAGAGGNVLKLARLAHRPQRQLPALRTHRRTLIERSAFWLMDGPGRRVHGPCLR